MNRTILVGLCIGLFSGHVSSQTKEPAMQISTGETIAVGIGNAGQLETSTTRATFEWRVANGFRIQVSADRQETLTVPETQVNVFSGGVTAVGPDWRVEDDSLRLAHLRNEEGISVNAATIEILSDGSAKDSVPFIPSGTYSCSGGTLFRNGAAVDVSNLSNRRDSPTQSISCDGIGNNVQLVNYTNGSNPHYQEF